MPVSFNNTPSHRAPDYMHSFIGYRAFNCPMYAEGHVTLLSPHTKETWTSPVRTAQCLQMCRLHPSHAESPTSLASFVRNHGALAPIDQSIPHSHGSCGIYTMHDLYTLPLNHPYVFAACKLSGKIEVHRDGCRSERVEVIALYVPHAQQLNYMNVPDDKLSLIKSFQRGGSTRMWNQISSLNTRKELSTWDRLYPDQPDPFENPNINYPSGFDKVPLFLEKGMLDSFHEYSLTQGIETPSACYQDLPDPNEAEW